MNTSPKTQSKWIVVALALLIGLYGVIPLRLADAVESDKKWGPKLTFEYQADRSRGLARLDALVPLWQKDKALFFTDLRYIDISGTGMEGNLGLGYRQLRGDLSIAGGDWIWGTYAFFDRRRTALENYFSQATLGAEILTPKWSFRTNGYLPNSTGYIVGSSTTTLAGPPTLLGTTVVSNTASTTITGKEWALPGFDVELGYGIETILDHELWFYGGYFRFDRSETPEIAGPRARLEYRMHDLFNWVGSEITLGAELRDDDLRGTDGLVMARVRIPIGKTSRNPGRGFENQMTSFVQRDVDIVTLIDTEETGGAGAPTGIVDPESGEILDVFFVNNNGTGNCTQNNPCTLTDVANNPSYGSGDIIVLVDSAGNIVGNVDLTTSIAGLGTDRRQVIGGEGDIVLNLSSGDNLALTGLGGRPVLDGTVTLSNQSIVKGFDILSPGTAVFGRGLNGTQLQDLRILNAANHALHLENVSGQVSISGFSVDQAAGTGIFLDGLSGSVNVGNGVIRNSGQGLVVRNNTGEIIFGSLTIDRTTGSAIDLSGAKASLAFERIDITGLGGGTGLNLNSSTANVAIDTLNIGGTGAAGSIGVDLRGASGAIAVANGGTIEKVVTAFNFDAASKATLDFKNGMINAGIPLNTVGVTQGTYDFTGTTFVKDSTLSLDTGFGNRFYFVDATGVGPGTPENPTSADFAEANAAPGDVILLVEDGTGNIAATGGLQLRDRQQLVGFAAGNAEVDFTGVNPRFLGPIVYLVADPTENGGATLENNGGTSVLALGNGVQVRDFGLFANNGAAGIVGNNFTGATLHNLEVSGSLNQGIRLFRPSGEVRISNSRFLQSTNDTFEINGGNANVRVSNSTILGSTNGFVIDISDTTGGRIQFDADNTISNVSQRGIRFDNIRGDIDFNGPVNVSTTLGRGVIAVGHSEATVSFNDRLTIRTQSGTGLQIGGVALNIAGGSINANGGAGIEATNTTVHIVLDTLSATSGGDGLNLTNVSGTITILDR